MKSSENKISKILFILFSVVMLSSFVSSALALITGFLFSYLLGNPFEKINQKTVSLLLKIAVVGLGFGMNIQETFLAGKDGFELTVFTILFTLLLGFLFGKYLNVHKKISYLISSGTAICGGSAIAAVSSVIDAKDKDISISLGVVFLLNSIALLIFPPIGHFLHLSQHQFGLWSAIAIHDTSSVVGAAFTYGTDALKVATTVKLARALWIIPVSLISIFLFNGKSKQIKIPWFIFLFVLVVIFNSYISIPDILSSSITTISKSLLVLTLFFIGTGLSIEKLKSAGIKPIILGVSLWIMVSVVSLSIIIMVKI